MRDRRTIPIDLLLPAPVSRRRCIGMCVSLGVLAGSPPTHAADAAPGGRAAPRPLNRSTKAEAEYQAEPRDIRSCRICSFFEAPTGCEVVEGPVSPSGWCKLFNLFD